MRTLQLEIGLRREGGWRITRAKSRNRRPAQWWFEEMRRVVDQAYDWSADGRRPDEQMVLRLAPRR